MGVLGEGLKTHSVFGSQAGAVVWSLWSWTHQGFPGAVQVVWWDRSSPLSQTHVTDVQMCPLLPVYFLLVWVFTGVIRGEDERVKGLRQTSALLLLLPSSTVTCVQEEWKISHENNLGRAGIVQLPQCWLIEVARLASSALLLTVRLDIDSQTVMWVSLGLLPRFPWILNRMLKSFVWNGIICIEPRLIVLKL